MNEILKIINQANEPIYALESYIEGLKNIKEKKIAWEDLREIAIHGELKQKFIVLNVISINKPHYLMELSLKLISVKDFRKNELILKPIVSICSICSQEKHIDYIIDVLHYAKKNKKEEIYEHALRNIIKTNAWKIVINELINIVKYEDELEIVDIFSFFISERGEEDYKKLKTHFYTIELEKISNLKDRINQRLVEKYQIKF